MYEITILNPSTSSWKVDTFNMYVFMRSGTIFLISLATSYWQLSFRHQKKRKTRHLSVVKTQNEQDKKTSVIQRSLLNKGLPSVVLIFDKLFIVSNKKYFYKIKFVSVVTFEFDQYKPTSRTTTTNLLTYLLSLCTQTSEDCLIW